MPRRAQAGGDSLREAPGEFAIPQSVADALDNCAAWISGWATTRGDHLAISDPLRRLSYAELEERISRLAGWLLAAGVTQGDRVALLLDNRSAYLESVFAAARIGAIAARCGRRPRSTRPRASQHSLQQVCCHGLGTHEWP